MSSKECWNCVGLGCHECGHSGRLSETQTGSEFVSLSEGKRIVIQLKGRIEELKKENEELKAEIAALKYRLDADSEGAWE